MPGSWFFWWSRLTELKHTKDELVLEYTNCMPLHNYHNRTGVDILQSTPAVAGRTG